MNDVIVGMENLPNVFINKILITPTSGGGSLIRVALLMYDSEIPSWKDKIQDLKVKIVFESRQSQIDALNNGEISLFDYPPSPVGMSTNDPYDSYVFSANEFSLSNTVNGYSSFAKSIEYRKPLRDNLNVYVSCFVDNLGFNNHPVFSKYYGPMAAEQIFVGGQLNTLSNYFYYPDTNEEYGGPVHIKPDGSFMEGSEHSDKDHKDLRLVTEENYKIQAYNVDFNQSNEVFAGRNIGNVSVRPTDVLTDVPDDIGPDIFSPITAITPTGVVLPDGGTRPFGFSGPTIEDPNVPDSTPDRIY